jgi:hypothetical protein
MGDYKAAREVKWNKGRMKIISRIPFLNFASPMRHFKCGCHGEESRWIIQRRGNPLIPFLRTAVPGYAHHINQRNRPPEVLTLSSSAFPKDADIQCTMYDAAFSWGGGWMDYLLYFGLAVLGSGLYLCRRFAKAQEFRFSKIIKIGYPDDTLLNNS